MKRNLPEKIKYLYSTLLVKAIMMKPLMEQYNIVEASGTKYALKQNQETELKTRLNSYKARQLFELIKEQQPQRFYQMIRDNKRVSFLNKISNQYLRALQEHISRGMNEAEAAEMEWPLLMQRAGLN